MSESQSRYSIVERLTSQKIELIDERSRLDRDIESTKQKIINSEEDLETIKKDMDELARREQVKRKQEISKFKSDLVFMESQKAKKLDAIEDKIKELDRALVSVEEISKTAPTPQQQV